MQAIVNNLTAFNRALENPHLVICNERGEWRRETRILGLFRRVKLLLSKKSDDSILRAFHRALSDIEGRKLYIKGSQETIDEQKMFYQDVLKAGKRILQLFEKSSDAKQLHLHQSLKISLIKMQYRIQIENGGLQIVNSAVSREDILKLTNLVNEFQRADERYTYTQYNNYTAKIHEICQYPEIVKFLIDPQHRKLAFEYLQLGLRDNLDIEVLNQYHYESKNLSDHFIARRTGAITAKILSIDTVQEGAFSVVKHLHMLMEKNKVNILDKSQTIRFSNGLEWTISQIYRDFLNKNLAVGELEMMYDGVIPFNGHHLSAIEATGHQINPKSKIYKRLDTTQADWFEKTPVLDIRNRQYINQRYNLDVQPGEWVTVLEATRRHELDAEQAHGYTLIYQPLEGDRYRVYSFGAFPWEFPQTILQLVNFVGDTVEGTIAFDPNYYYSQSQKASWAHAVDEKIARALLAELGQAKNKGFIFQFAWENCAFFMRDIFIKVFEKTNMDIAVPCFFRKKFLNTRPRGALLIIQKIFKKTPAFVHPIFKWMFAALFRATRKLYVYENGKKMVKTLVQTPFFRELKINAPSAMHYRIKKFKESAVKREKDIKKYERCVLNYGHDSMKVYNS